MFWCVVCPHRDAPNKITELVLMDRESSCSAIFSYRRHYFLYLALSAAIFVESIIVSVLLFYFVSTFRWHSTHIWNRWCTAALSGNRCISLLSELEKHSYVADINTRQHYDLIFFVSPFVWFRNDFFFISRKIAWETFKMPVKGNWWWLMRCRQTAK